MTLGEQIKQKREEQHLSQEGLAERVGVSRQAVSKWESDRAVPSGANRRALCQALSLEWPETVPFKHSERGRILCAAGWGTAGVLLLILVCGFLHLKRASGTPFGLEEPAILSVRFYDAMQEEVLPEALWYNAAEMESILIQWMGHTPETIKMFYTPSGTETMDQTELLALKAPADGESALLLSAGPLHREDLLGHVYFELDFGGNLVLATDSLYNVLFDQPPQGP